MRSGCVAVLAALSVLGPRAGAAEPPVVDWSQVGEHVGKDVVVEGRVVGVECSRQTCQLAFEPTARRFAAVVEALDFDLFPPHELDARYNGRPVRVRGTVVRPSGRPEIVLRRADQLELLTDAAAPGADAANERPDPLERQAEILERLAAVLERIEALAEQLAAAEERLGAVLDAVEQRQSELQSMLAALAPPAVEPPILPEPRVRRYEAMRGMKRGMSATEVERLFGQPTHVENVGAWSVWHYEPGRSVSFNARGRVEAFVGF
jgi:hypothetical protein